VLSSATPAIHRLGDVVRRLVSSPMRHTLKLHGVVIGWSDLEQIQPDLGRARGRFRPGMGYDLVQPVFRLYAEAVPRADAAPRDDAKLARYYKSRDALHLELFDPGGRRVPTSAIHIADYTIDGGGECELDVLIADADYWERRSTPS
jgi:hypothetical protein